MRKMTKRKNIDFDDSLIYSEISKEIKERKIKMKQMNREDALEAFKIWQNKEDKIKYTKNIAFSIISPP